MAAESAAPRTGILYQPDETPSATVTVGLGLQFAVFSLSGMMMIPMLIFRAAGVAEALLTWAVFASLVICGAVTALQAFRIGRVGAGYLLITGTTTTAIAVATDALAAGGPALLAALMLVCSVFQLVFSTRLSLFRRILTPSVAGTVYMLIPATVMPVIFGMLDDVPAGYPALAAPLPALVTALVVGGTMLKGAPKLRPWAPVAGIVAGSATAGFFGLYDVDRVFEAAWIGIPTGWPGFLASPATHLDFGPSFWGMLPAFLLVFLICTIRTASGSLAIQGVSWRRRRALDFRAAQGAVAADTVSNLLSGLAGTVPNGVHAVAVSLVELTGVAARRVGVVCGAALAALAFFPKVLALVLAVPGPVIAGYVMVLLATVFTIGMKMAVSDGLDQRQGLIVGVSFWIGVGCQYGFIFPDHISTFAGGLLNSGLTAGGLLAISLTTVLELTAPRRKRIETELDVTALPELRGFMSEFAVRGGYGTGMADRLDAVSEETVLTLMRDEAETAAQRRRLLVTARREGAAAVLEFIAAGGADNFEDRLALLGESAAGDSVEREVSLRLLRHLSAEVRHQQYHDVDIVTVRVAEPEAMRE